ncbi:MAG: phage portal protein [Deltaproteobacteria bacterium]|jgi:lambda family phage portal protein|nr:phage portal protein [Deltaproteobacteria bacterium]
MGSKLWPWNWGEKASQKERKPFRDGKRYQAAEASGLERDIYPTWERNFNDLVARSNPRLRQRVYRMTRNFPPFVRAIKVLQAFIIGEGGRFESLAERPNGEPDLKLRKEIERRFSRWTKKATVDNRLNFYESQLLALKQKLETGEFFNVFRTRKSGPRKGELALQFIEPERVTSSVITYADTGDVIVEQGIEFDRHTGERFAYYVEPTDPALKVASQERIPEEQVIHGFETLRPGQLRGVTPFAPAIILADCMFDYMEAELDGAKMAAKWLAFVTSPSPKETQMMRVRGKKDDASENSRIEEIENCVIEYLKTGEEIKFSASSDRVKDNFDRFARFVLRMVGVTMGVPYELISGDYTGVNYSTSRMSRQDFNLILKPERHWMKTAFNESVFEEWLKFEALKNPSFFPDYFENPERYQKALWIPAGMPSPDPLKEGKADIDNIKAGLVAPQDVILARGDDPEMVIARRVEWKKMEEDNGLKSEIDQISTWESTNPAALEKEAEAKKDGGDGGDEDGEEEA